MVIRGIDNINDIRSAEEDSFELISEFRVVIRSRSECEPCL